MFRKLQYACLVGSIGLIGADRIDLFAGHGPFVLTPFLVLAPLVVLFGLLRVQPAGIFRITVTKPLRRQAPFITASVIFLLLSFLSVPFGLDPERGVVAFSGLLLVAVLGYCTSVQILTAPAQARLILRSVTFALLLYVIFCIGECVAWTHGLVMVQAQSYSWIESTFAPDSFGYWAPRLSGTAVDSNRSGFVLVMYLALLDRFVSEGGYKRILRLAIPILVLLTLSRSAVLCLITYYLSSASFWKRLASRRTVARLAAIAIVSSLICVVYQKEIIGLADAWEISDALSARMSVDKGSSGESHILLIRRGFQTWLTSPQTIVAGIGFAAAPKVLGDFFGDDKYGNFHSLYVTVLAEMGLPACVILIFLLGYPVITRKGAVPCMAALMVFNVSYQSHMEPLFWVTVALVWSLELRDAPKFLQLAIARVPPTYPEISVRQ